MWWLIHKLKKNNQQRINQQKCRRCGLLYLKVLDNCPHCSGVNDQELKILLRKRAKFRVGIGKAMIIGALAIMLLLVLIN